MNENTSIALIAMLVFAAVGILFVALRYDDARLRRIHLARKRQLEPHEPLAGKTHNAPHNPS